MTELSDYKRLVEAPMLDAFAATTNAMRAEIDRLRAALYDAREYVEHQVKATGTVWAQDRLDKIDAALSDQQAAPQTEKP